MAVMDSFVVLLNEEGHVSGVDNNTRKLVAYPDEETGRTMTFSRAVNDHGYNAEDYNVTWSVRTALPAFD